MKKTEEQFIKDSKEKFGDRFGYSKCKYTGSKEKVTLICKKHNYNFLEIPYWEKDVVGFLINKINI